MAKFKYTAVDSSGKEKKGKIDGLDEAAATIALKNKDCFLPACNRSLMIRIKQRKKGKPNLRKRLAG